MPETAPSLPNEPAARTPTGEILNQNSSSTPTEITPNAEPTEPKTPTEYTPFTAPEGSSLDPKAIEGATAIFKELGLSQAQAQKLIDWGSARESASVNKSAEAYNQMRTEWRTQTESDPMLTGYKGGLEGALADISKAIATFPPKLQTEFKDAMTLTGAGDNPAIVKGFLTLAKERIEGQHVSGSGPSEEGQRRPGEVSRPSAAQAMFPTLPSASTH